MKTIYALIMMLALAVTAHAQTSSFTLEIDMQPAIDSAKFDPATDSPDVMGSFNAWATGIPLTLKSGAIYTAIIPDLTDGDVVEFKVRPKSAWDNTEEFALGGVNRQFVVVDGFVYTCAFNTAGATGIAEVSNNIQSVNQYPNPANNQVSLTYSLTNSSQVSVSFYNVVGAEVLNVTQTQSAGSNNQSIDVSSLENGMYFYTLKSDNKEQSKGKILINR